MEETDKYMAKAKDKKNDPLDWCGFIRVYKNFDPR
jgi:hypothetical protein